MKSMGLDEELEEIMKVIISGSLSTSEFFVITGLVLTVTFLVFAKISIVLYKGYKRLDSENLELLSNNGFVPRSNTFPPTDV
eukprot:PDM64948.1 hypothetical protein PRIPAC_53204 [Pristionchus pacificus]